MNQHDDGGVEGNEDLRRDVRISNIDCIAGRSLTQTSIIGVFMHCAGTAMATAADAIPSRLCTFIMSLRPLLMEKMRLLVVDHILQWGSWDSDEAAALHKLVWTGMPILYIKMLLACMHDLIPSCWLIALATYADTRLGSLACFLACASTHWKHCGSTSCHLCWCLQQSLVHIWSAMLGCQGWPPGIWCQS